MTAPSRRDWKNLFLASDFGECPHWGNDPCDCECDWNEMADKANAILLEAIESAPRVYGLDETSLWNPERKSYQTHEARLIDIQPIANTKGE